MGVEIERKYLVHAAAWGQVKGKGILYRQGYLLREKDKTVRVRLIEGDQGYMTIKGKATGFARPEYEYAIPEKDAAEMLDAFCDAVITKKRYKIAIEGKLWEVDEFLEDNAGLIVAEIELQDAAETFYLPEWIDKEVTEDARYYNSQLSVHPYKKWGL